MPNLIRDGIIKTRKNHKCHGCCEIIPKGASAHSQIIVYNNRIYTLYMCDSCRDWCKSCSDCIDSEDALEGYIKECMEEAAWSE